MMRGLKEVDAKGFPRAIAYLKHFLACETQGKYEPLSLALA
jgi:hypothetical protein